MAKRDPSAASTMRMMVPATAPADAGRFSVGEMGPGSYSVGESKVGPDAPLVDIPLDVLEDVGVGAKTRAPAGIMSPSMSKYSNCIRHRTLAPESNSPTLQS